MAPKVILINHEKRLPVDSICANMGIKYSFMYLSVYQVIKQHIDNDTDFGKRLLATKKSKLLDMRADPTTKDEVLEEDYSAVHFDLDLVIEVMRHTIN